MRSVARQAPGSGQVPRRAGVAGPRGGFGGASGARGPRRGAWARLPLAVLVAALVPANARAVTDPAGDASAGDLPPDGSFVRVSVDGGVSPFTVASWDVTVRGRTAVVSLVKETLCYTGQRERVRLLEGEKARALLKSLVDAGAWSPAVPAGATAGRAKDAPASSREARYEVWSAWGRRMNRYHLPQSALAAVPGALQAVTTVTSAVRDRLDPLPMRDLYYPQDRLGYVNLTASEPATAVLDGWDQVRLPVDALEVVEGEHDVLVTGESGATRQFRMKVVPGMTQRVHVLLEASPENGGSPPADGSLPLP